MDSAGNAYVTGLTNSTDFPVTTGAFQTTYGGGGSGDYDAFVTKVNATGTGLVYSTYFGGIGYDLGNGIAVNSSGYAYVAGYTDSSNFPITTGAFQTTFSGEASDVFVTKLNATGTGLVYSTYLGGSSTDLEYGMAVDPSGNAYVTGFTNSINFPVTADALQSANGGGGDAFVTKLNATGTGLVYSTYLGGSDQDYGRGIAVDLSGSAYVTGFTRSNNFPVTTGAFQTTFGGVADAFVVKMSLTNGVVDNIPPSTIATASPGPNINGWNNTNVAVNLSATDNPGGSGVEQIQFALTGAQSLGWQTVAGNAASVTISAEGTTTLSYFATDNAGNQETANMLTVRIDKTPPVISGLPAPGCTLWPPNHKLVQVATVTAADALSGLAPGSFRVTGTSNDPGNGQIVITGGPSQFLVQLGADKGQVYTLTATAGDLAGNTSTQQATCAVPHDQGK